MTISDDILYFNIKVQFFVVFFYFKLLPLHEDNDEHSSVFKRFFFFTHKKKWSPNQYLSKSVCVCVCAHTLQSLLCS